MKTVKVCYSIRNNVGDALNPLIIEQILGKKVIWANQFECETSAIGSGLRRFFISRNYAYKSLSCLKSIIKGKLHNSPCQIWSAGFIFTPEGNEVPIKKQLNISSVRGALSKQALERIYGKQLNITTGDAGLLASELLPNAKSKQYLLGIIPHDRERNELKYQMIKNQISNSIIIDVQADPMEVLSLISQCEVIISSSLHGLIISDSFGIPNKQVVLTDKLIGDGFKFKDYYSSFDLGIDAININEVDKIDIDYIKNSYKITHNMIDKKKAEIIDAFNKYL
jgi:hypothetical protein